MSLKNIKHSIAISMVAFASYSSASMAMIREDIEIDRSVVSQNFEERTGVSSSILMLHCVGLSDEWIFQNYGLSKASGGLGVSAHYYISQQSQKIYELVPDEKMAFHAGPSGWRGSQSLNNISIGIEFQSPGYAQINEEGYYPYSFASYSEEQMKSGIALSKQIMKTHSISSENVVWHSDVSPVRGGALGKTDPGPLFDAKRFAQNGIGVWPSSDRLEDSQLDTSLIAIQTALKDWGYPYIEANGFWDGSTKYVLAAHYMHYLPDEVNWESFKNQKSGSIFDTVNDWNEFFYDKEVLSVSLENLNKKNFAFQVEMQ